MYEEITAVASPGPGNPLHIVIAEYAEHDVALSTEQARTLRQLVGNRLQVLPSDETGRWRIRATSYVGTVVTTDIRVMIVPKVPTANLFHMLEASGNPVNLASGNYDYKTSNDLLPAFATFFARHLDAALAMGMPRSYQEIRDQLHGIRGRVDLTAQVRMAGLPIPTSCIFDEYTADVQINRILRAATDRLVRLPGVPLATRRNLRRLATVLCEAGSLRAEDLQTECRFTRMTEHCRSAERLARLTLRSTSLAHAHGSTAAGAFLVDMNQVFEEFVESRVRRYLPRTISLHGQWPDRLDVNGEVHIRPDLVLTTPQGTPRYVADAKYKVTADGLGRESDYYQLLAYTAALDLPEGLLVYCQHDGSAPARSVEVRHVGKRLCTWAVRLDRSPTHVEDEMRALSEHLAQRALNRLPQAHTEPASVTAFG